MLRRAHLAGLLALVAVVLLGAGALAQGIGILTQMSATTIGQLAPVDPDARAIAPRRTAPPPVTTTTEPPPEEPPPTRAATATTRAPATTTTTTTTRPLTREQRIAAALPPSPTASRTGGGTVTAATTPPAPTEDEDEESKDDPRDHNQGRGNDARIDAASEPQARSVPSTTASSSGNASWKRSSSPETGCANASDPACKNGRATVKPGRVPR